MTDRMPNAQVEAIRQLIKEELQAFVSATAVTFDSMAAMRTPDQPLILDAKKLMDYFE